MIPSVCVKRGIAQEIDQSGIEVIVLIGGTGDLEGFPASGDAMQQGFLEVLHTLGVGLLEVLITKLDDMGGGGCLGDHFLSTV